MKMSRSNKICFFPFLVNHLKIVNFNFIWKLLREGIQNINLYVKIYKSLILDEIE